MGTWIAGAIVFILVCLAVYKIVKDRKNGKNCGCGCNSCPSRPRCLKSDNESS